MSVLILEPDGYSPRALEIHSRLGAVWLRAAPPGQEERVSLLVVRLGQRLVADFLSRYPSLTAIATPTTGLTHIDLSLCRKQGIRVFSLADCRQAIERVTSTSELTIGLIIALLRRIPQAHADVISGHWNRDRFRSRQMSRLVLGIVGLGRIGGHVAGYAKALGMRVIACDPYQPPSRFADMGAEARDLNALVGEADIISIHANLREDNVRLISRSVLALMRDGALLINTARGALLDEDEAASALRSGRLSGLAVDVLADEHGDTSWSDSPLIAAARDGLNVIITPHIGGCTSDAMHITEECLADTVVHALREDE
jgi:D-3-phosphoglycerate dehydrogenase